MLKVGFTGTQQGMSSQQLAWLKRSLSLIDEEFEFHQGDCVGADAEAAELVARNFEGAIIHSHPPDNPSKRAFMPAHVIHEEKPYLERNRDIVDASDVLIGMPKGFEEVRSGTWATIRDARKKGKRRRVILPDGKRNKGD